MIDGGHHAFLVEDRWPYSSDQPPGFPVSLAKHRDAGRERLGRRFGTGVFQMFVGLQLHDRAGQLLGKLVVDFVGDQLTLVVARLQQVLQRAISAFQSLLATAAFGRVFHQGKRVIQRPILATKPPDKDGGVDQSAILADVAFFARIVLDFAGQQPVE
jgi:hypothetical protein